jgi:hypothetical protein
MPGPRLDLPPEKGLKFRPTAEMHSDFLVEEKFNASRNTNRPRRGMFIFTQYSVYYYIGYNLIFYHISQLTECRPAIQQFRQFDLAAD